MAFTFLRLGMTSALAALILMVAHVWAEATTINIVAIGASNTAGWGVAGQNAYPAQLEAMLRAKGYEAHVTNAGVNFETTAGMLRRIDSAVPSVTNIVILQPGGNDLRFFSTKEKRAANIAEMVSRLQGRNIKVIVFDPVIPRRYYRWGGIHLTVEGHTMFASAVLPQVVAAIGQESTDCSGDCR